MQVIQKEFFADLEERKKNLSKDELSEFEDVFCDDIDRHESEFVHIQRNSLFISLMAFAENEGTLLCRIVKERGNHTLKLSDLNGTGLCRVGLYMKKVINIREVFKLPVWSRLRDLKHKKS